MWEGAVYIFDVVGLVGLEKNLVHLFFFNDKISFHLVHHVLKWL